MKLACMIGLLSFLVAPSAGQTSAQRGLVKAADTHSFSFPLSGRMRWTGNRLAGCDFCQGNHPILWVADRQGNRTSVAFDLPGAGYTNVRDVAAGPDGSLTAVGLVLSGDSRMTTFVAWISADSTRQVLTQVWPYDPQVVTVASDGSLWTIGALMNDKNRVVYPNVLRHYTSSGQLLASTFIRDARKNKGGLYTVSPTSVLMVSNDRVGWLTMTCQYIEFSLEAVQMGNYTCPNGYTNVLEIAGVALSSGDDLLIGGKWLAPLAPLALDRMTNTWKSVPVSQDSGKTQMLLGFDGLILVTNAMTNGAGPGLMRRYNWSADVAGGGQ